MDNPFKSFTHVSSAQALLDIAFKRAMKSSASVSKNAPILIKAKKKESARVKTAIDELIKFILNIIKSVPIIDELPQFYKELASLLVDVDQLKLNLGKLNGILPVLSKLEREYLKKLSKIEMPREGDRLRRSVIGRISSIVKKQDGALRYLNEVRGDLRSMPSIDLTKPCVVVAGYPNVGKSSLVKLISTNKKIEVQEYPFTTKKLNMGHYTIQRKFDSVQIQVLDTPGILDRPMNQRNAIELQAILALRLVSDLIIFIFDPTPACGYSIKSQVELYKEIRQNFTRNNMVGILIVFNKIDLAKQSEIDYLLDLLDLTREDVILINALKGDNIDSVLSYLNARYSNLEV
ncbi:MAG: NOG1 family protein [Promethearchaeota archaeon]